MKKFIMMLTVAALLVGSAVPGQAALQGKAKASVAAITCTITLDDFPHEPKVKNSTDCVGTGIVGASLGLIRTAPGGLVVSGGVATPIRASAQYFEPCSELGGTGTANGRITSAHAGTAVAVYKTGSAAVYTDAYFDAPYTWERFGVVALITLGKLAGDKKGGDPNKKKYWNNGTENSADQVGGVGIGTLTPLGAPTGSDPITGQCVAGNQPLTVVVNAVAAWV